MSEPKNFLVTAGGMRQPIDDVRAITNSSRGALGVKVVEQILAQAASLGTIFFVHGPGCALPAEHPQVTCLQVSDVTGLLDTVTALLEGQAIHYVVHAMAVADYMPVGVLTADQVAGGGELPATPRKVSSDHDELYVKLVRTPKVVDHIKRTSPRSFLVAFKLLSGASDQELHDAAFALLRRTRAGMVIANDLQQIRSGQPHRALLVLPEKHTDVITDGKDAIAARLVDVMLRRGETRYGKTVIDSRDVPPAADDALAGMRKTGALLADGLPVVDGGTYGNLSVRARQGGFVVTGRGVDKRALTAQRIMWVSAADPSDDPAVYRVIHASGAAARPSIDAGIHAMVYDTADVACLVHIHDPALYLDLPLTAGNFSCGTEHEARSVVDLVEPGARTVAVQLHKHGLLVGHQSFAECLTLLEQVQAGVKLTPMYALDGTLEHGAGELVDEWEQHVAEVGADPRKRSALTDPRCLHLIVEAHRAVGVAGYRPAWREGRWTGEFFLYLSERLERSRGLGAKALGMINARAARDGCADLHLVTRAGCDVERFYAKFGFTVAERSGEDIVMRGDVRALSC